MSLRLIRTALFPVRQFRAMWRRKLTKSSNLAMLAIIASLNVIWGFPLLGVLVSLLLLLSLSWLANRWFRPRLRVQWKMPNLIACDSPSECSMTIANIGPLPVFDLEVGVADLLASWRLGPLNSSYPTAVQRDRAKADAWLGTIDALESRAEVSVPCSFLVTARGEFQLPPVQCQSTFPFHLFRSAQQFVQTTNVLVTPKLTEVDALQVSELARVAGDSVGGLLTGDSFEYAGNREWVDGDSPRSWDHAAWARLGRPIVREFQLLTSGHLLLFVDTVVADMGPQADSVELERRLSMAASIIESLRWTPCEIGLMMIQQAEIVEVRSTHDDTDILLAQLARTLPTPLPVATKPPLLLAIHHTAAERIAAVQAKPESSMVIITVNDQQPAPPWIKALTQT